MSALLTLQLGAGDVLEFDYDLRLDLRDLPGVNLIGDAAKLEGIENGTVAVIKASHLIEHFTAKEQAQVLREWRRVMPIDGILLIWTPDRDWFDKAVKEGTITQDEYDITLGVNGRARYDYERCAHLCVWNTQTAWDTLDRAGFEVIYSEVENGGSLFVMARAL